jgi:hypothetical protein
VGITRNLFFCLNAPAHLRNHLHQAFDPERQSGSRPIEDTIRHPYRIFLVLFMSWYHWNSELFWALRDNMVGLESIRTSFQRRPILN